MASELSTIVIQKLGHKIPEIRKRALDYIDQKFTVENTLNYNASLLMKYLIRWFGFRPLMNEQIVLNLMHVILTGRYGREVIKTLGFANLKIQFEKIDQLLHNSTNKKILFELVILLELHSNDQTAIVDTEIFDLSKDEEYSFKNTQLETNHIVAVYEEPRESMTTADLNSLKLLKFSLKTNDNTEDFEKGIQASTNAIHDFPAEFFLQPPYIYDCLKKLLNTVKENPYQSADVLDIFSKLTIALEKRIKTRKMSQTYIWHIHSIETNAMKNQITVGHYCFEMLQVSLNTIRDLSNSYQGYATTKCYMLMFNIISLMECDGMLEFSFESILEEFGYHAKFLRESPRNIDCKSTLYSNRIEYFLVLLLISKLLKLSSSKVEINYENRYAASVSEDYSRVRLLLNENSSWIIELEIALLDFSLEECHRYIYDNILASIKAHQSPNYQQILTIRENIKILTFGIDLLKNPDSYNDKDLIFKGYHAVETLSLHRSIELVDKLFQAISNVSVNFDNDPELKKFTIDLFLRLLSHSDIDCKRKIYNLCASKVKYYFGSLLSGEINITNSSVHIKKSFFGLPINADILFELICFGYECEDNVVKNYAENILSLLLKGKHLLKQNWKNLLEIFVPIFPLLQCHATNTTTLGKQIIEIFAIDGDIPLLQLIKGNIILLFNNESSVRDEAMSRILHLLSVNLDAHLYLPQIINVADIIKNNICLLDTPYDIQKNIVINQYEASTVYPLIELLESSNIEPVVRKTTLNQLNVMAQDPQLTAIINERNGLFLILSALDDSLKETHSTYYPDSAIPAIGIIAKLCLQIMRFRHELSNEVNVYFLLLRALLLFHQHPGLKIDCTVTLFLLVFNDYTIGSNDISIPNILKKLRIPFKCNIRLKQSQFNKISQLEELLLQHNTSHSSTVSDSDVSSEISANIMTNFINKNYLWQYTRTYFAYKWFDNLNNFVVKHNKPSNITIPNYDIYVNSLNFDQQLKLTVNDIISIQSTLPDCLINYWLKTISNATSHGDVLLGLSQIESFILSSSNKNVIQFNDFKNVTTRFLSSVPNTHGDEMVYKLILNVIEQLIDREDIQQWIIHEMEKKNNGFLNVLHYGKCSSLVYYENCRFIGMILQKNAINEKILSIQNTFLNILIKLINQNLLENDMDKLRSLLLLLRTLSAMHKTNIDDDYAQIITEKLFEIISAIRLTTKNVSSCIKNCLISCGNIMTLNKITIDAKNLKLLSGLCGQSDYEIRTFSWNILLQVSQTLIGAISIVQDLSFLPGGFLSCCLSTCLDPHECSTVREASGFVFANLISFCEIKLDSNVLSDDTPTLSVSRIMQIVRQQRFLYEVSESIKCIWIHEAVECNMNGPITTCNLIRAFCMVLSNLLRLDDELLRDYNELHVTVDLARLIPMVLRNTQKSSLLMLSEICLFLSLCFRLNSDIYDQISIQEHAVIVALIEALNMNVYDPFSNDLKMQTLINILTLLKLLLKNECSFQLFCTTLSNDIKMHNFLNLIKYALNNNELNDLSIIILQFITTTMLTNQCENSQYNEFIQLLDTTNVVDSQHKVSQQISILLIDLFTSTKKNPKQWKLVNKTIATLFKFSSNSRRIAEKMNFFDQILHELNDVHQSLQIECVDYNKRQSESKKNRAIGQFKMLYGIILHWYYNDCLDNVNNVKELCSISVKIWPLTNSSFYFQVVFLNCLAFLSEDSVIVCQAFSSHHIGNTPSILQKAIELVQTDIARAKHPTTDLSGFSKAVQILTNCCACIEGRSLMAKMNIFDSINRLHPIVTKQQRIWNVITLIWLKFYEVYTRYPDMNTTKHLSILCTFILKSDQQIRFTSLLILRNIAFSSSNKSALLANDDYLCLVKNIIDDGTPAEQQTIVTSLWKLIANNYKSKHAIKNSSMPKKLSSLAHKLRNNTEQSDLLHSLKNLTECLYN